MELPVKVIGRVVTPEPTSDLHKVPHPLQSRSLDQFIRKNMAPTRLLRYIFRHGPQGSSHNAAPTLSREPRARTHTSPSSKDQEVCSSLSTESIVSEESDPPLVQKTRSESRATTILDDIAEESGSDEDISMADSLAALNIDIYTFTTRELLTATLNQAKLSLHAHLNTVGTTLEVLRALDGFSATIAAIKCEMEVTKEICEEKLKVIQDLERFIDCLWFGNEQTALSSMLGGQ
ncbi:hypothetical protein DE146DRAFT_611636 [Phaeosphaeria sp. MPI-PUGE-AT-0046c]|nr:hypothetical protein DE146DRAFT_611636 [Phaeosphaeria sp. MPI-PUGE-AT-0046c]